MLDQVRSKHEALSAHRFRAQTIKRVGNGVDLQKPTKKEIKMEIGKIYVISSGQAEIVFSPEFREESGLLQLDLIQDLLGDIKEVYEKMVKDGGVIGDKTFDEVMEDLDAENNETTFVLQRQMGSLKDI